MKKYIRILAVVMTMALLFGSGYYTALHFGIESIEEEQETDDAVEQQSVADASPTAEEQGGEEKKGAGETEEKEEMEKAVKRQEVGAG